MSALEVRSLLSRNLAWSQPVPGSPMRLSLGTRTLSRKTSQVEWSPLIIGIVRTVTPGVFMSSTSIEMPLCGRSVCAVRTRKKPMFEN